MFSTILTLLLAFAIGQSTASSRISNSTFTNATLTNAITPTIPTLPIWEIVTETFNKTEIFEESLQETTSYEAPLTTTTFWDSDVVSTTNAVTLSPVEDHSDVPVTEEDASMTWIRGDESTINAEPTEETTPASSNENFSKSGTVINCFCGVDQVLVDDNCVPLKGGTYVTMPVSRTNDYTFYEAPMVDQKAIIRDLVCDTGNGSRELTFSREQFYLRDTGDIVLMEKAGDLNGLRSSDYCIFHFLDHHGSLTWTAKVCVAPPSVPRCCPQGKTMKNNACLPSRTPENLEPPISADLYSSSAASWPVIKNYVKPLNCTTEPMKDIPLIPGESYLASHPIGLVHIWNSEETDYKPDPRFDSKYCVDGRQNRDGSTSFSVKICFENPIERHHRMCDDNVCVRKCCHFGEVVNTDQHRCVAGASEFAPQMNTDYKIVVGFPLKYPATIVTNFSLSPETGYLSTWNETASIKWNITLPPSEYCIDTFLDREGQSSLGAVASVDLLSHWEKNRKNVFPICMTISLIFLLLIVVCYATVPILLANTGKSHLCHVLSLIVAYSCGVTLRFLNHIDFSTCVALGITMQFGYLSAFFWLSVLCFDVWRLFRNLESKLRPPTPIPPYVYHIYAWGGPLVICSATLILQFVDTHDIQWLIKPHLGEGNCWFGPDKEVFVFFYLYIAILLSANCIFIGHTYWSKRKMDQSLSAVRGDKRENGAKPSTETTFRNRDVYSEFITKFLLLALMSTCWVTEVLSWKIPPMELWAVTDTINSLQGFFIFVIFLQDKRKREHLHEKFPKLFGFFKSILQGLKKIKNAMPCSRLAKDNSSPFTYISTLNRKLSPSSLVSSLSTLSSSLSLSPTSSLEMGNNSKGVHRSESVDEDNGIVALSFSRITQMDSYNTNSSLC